MPLPPRYGYIALIVSVICNGARYHLDKAALRTCTPAVAVIIGALAATAALLLAGAGWRTLRWKAGGLHEVSVRSVLGTFTGNGPLLLAATICGALGGWLVAKTVGEYTAELAAFLANMTLVFLVIGGLLSGEKLKPLEALLVAVILAGAFMFSYKGGQILWRAVLLMALGCLFTAAKQLLIKKAVTIGSLSVNMTAALFLMAVWAVPIGWFGGTLHVPTREATILLILAGVVGSMVGMSLLYTGYKSIGVSRAAPIDAMRPLAVLLIALTLGHEPPGLMQIMGGGLVLAGSAALGRLLVPQKRPPHEVRDPLPTPPSSLNP